MFRYFSAIMSATVIVFILRFISYELVRWHEMEIRTFKDGTAVEQAITNNHKGSGIYYIPNHPERFEYNADTAQAWDDKKHKGPFYYLRVQPDGAPSLGTRLLMQFAIELVIASFLAFLFQFLGPGLIRRKAAILAVIVMVGALATQLISWSLYGHPLSTSLLTVLDLGARWFFASLALVAMLSKNGPEDYGDLSTDL